MKKLLIRLAALTLAATLLLTGCSQQNSSQPSQSSGVQQSSATLPLLPEGGWEKIDWSAAEGTPGELAALYTPKYAKGFTIAYYYGGAKVIKTQIAATANTGAYSQSILVLPEGAVEPKDEATYDYRLEGNLERVITYASSHAGFFSQLDATNLIKGTSIQEKNCYIPSLKNALQAGDTIYVGSGQKGDKELMASLQPQIITVGGMQSDVEIAQKLEESGIFCLYFGDFAEEHYMGRAEWLTLVGALCGKEAEAQALLMESESKVNALIARAGQVEEKPRVLWFTHSSQTPHWNVRTDSDYVNSMVSALGGQMLFPEGTQSNSIKLSNEDFLPLMMQADRIVFGVSLNSYSDAKDITYFNKEGQIDFALAPAFQQQNCYVVGYDWAQDTANVTSIMESLAIALYPQEFTDLQNSGKIIPFQVQS